MTLPLVVADRREVPRADLDARLEQAWTVSVGFDLPAEPWDLSDRRWVRVGTVDDDAQLEAAVLAAARGVGVAAGCPDPDRRDRLVDDLGRVGAVSVVLLGNDPLDQLDDDQRIVLETLAAGGSIADAAARAHLSTRTTERRLAAARKVLGLRTTAEAVALVSGGDTRPGRP